MVLFKFSGEIAADKLSVDFAGLKMNLLCPVNVVSDGNLPVTASVFCKCD